MNEVHDATDCIATPDGAHRITALIDFARGVEPLAKVAVDRTGCIVVDGYTTGFVVRFGPYQNDAGHIVRALMEAADVAEAIAEANAEVPRADV